jgi:hypothetical protein
MDITTTNTSELIQATLIHLALSRQRFEISKDVYVASYESICGAFYNEVLNGPLFSKEA